MITLLTALPSEARPLIRHYRLRAIGETPFRVYAGDAHRLVISGIGSHAAATAVGYCAGLRAPRAHDLWVNVGIAGHRTLACGTPVLAGRVRHSTTNQNWFPALAFRTDLAVHDVVSHDQPVSDYPPDVCVDMEAAGFMAAASRVGDGDALQVMKVISDNADSGLKMINRAYVTTLIEDSLAALDVLLEALSASVAVTVPPPSPAALEQVLQQWRFTHSQRHQLHELARRLYALDADAAWPDALLEHCASAAEVLHRLDAHVQTRTPRFGP